MSDPSGARVISFPVAGDVKITRVLITSQWATTTPLTITLKSAAGETVEIFSQSENIKLHKSVVNSPDEIMLRRAEYFKLTFANGADETAVANMAFKNMPPHENMGFQFNATVGVQMGLSVLKIPGTNFGTVVHTDNIPSVYPALYGLNSITEVVVGDINGGTYPATLTTTPDGIVAEVV
jgi:hypothetical protein